MKKLYIHIGRAKTGTTALQNFMATNAGPLAAYGVKYADTGRFYTAHHPLAWSLHREANESCGGRYWPRASRYARLEMEPAEYWAAMLREMNTSDHEAFVVSSEEFGVVLDLHLTAPLLARHLKGVEVYIVVYFRRQDEFLQSVYNQAVKGEEDRFTGSFWDYVNPILEVGGADCMKVVSPLAEAFGEDRIIVRVYEKEQLKATIFDDFLSVFGIESGDGFTQIERVQNPRLSPELLSVIRKMNRIPMAATVRHRLLGMLLERYPRTRTFSSHGVLSPINRLQLLERFRESNAKVARTYLGRADGRLFLAPEPDPNEPFREVAFSTEEALNTVTDLWAEYVSLKRPPAKGKPDRRMNGSADMKKGDERKIILVELTNHCNFACTLCPHAYYGKETPVGNRFDRKKGFISRELFDILVAEAKQHAKNLNMSFFGEPMVHPGFSELVRSIPRERPFVLTLNTNWSLFTPAKHLEALRNVDFVYVSLDTTNPERYDELCPGSDVVT